MLIGPVQQFDVYCDFRMPYTRNFLEDEFSKDGVDKSFYDGTIWAGHATCRYLNRNPDIYKMVLQEFDIEPNQKDFDEMYAHGFRHARLQELFAFAQGPSETQDVLKKYHVFALGSTAWIENHEYCAKVFSAFGRKILQAEHIHSQWFPYNRFLFVHV